MGPCKAQYVRSVDVETPFLRLEPLFQSSDMVLPNLYGRLHSELRVKERHMNPRLECLVDCPNTVSGQEENALEHVSLDFQRQDIISHTVVLQSA